MIIVTLSECPPTANRRLAQGKKGWIPNRKYAAWKSNAVSELADVGALEEPLGGYVIKLTFWFPDRRKRDLDNYIKAPLDALVDAGVIVDDSKVSCIMAMKGPEMNLDGCSLDDVIPGVDIEIYGREEYSATLS